MEWKAVFLLRFSHLKNACGTLYTCTAYNFFWVLYMSSLGVWHTVWSEF